jgi:tetratricopeptide (TPR) repeat protein
MNLALTLNQAGRYDEALALCTRLEDECGDAFSAASHRSAVYLNTRRWEQAVEHAKRYGGDLDPSAGFAEAFALFELERYDEALTAFLRASLHYPRAARMLVGERTTTPKSYDEARDHTRGGRLLNMEPRDIGHGAFGPKL